MDSPIAITGMSGKFPNSDNVNQFRDNLFNKVDLILENQQRWSKLHQEVPLRSIKLNGINEFDFGFFGLSKKAANVMDPCTRIGLEKVYEALLDAGHHAFDFRSEKSGVHVTMSTLESEFWTIKQKYKNAEVMVHSTRSSMRSNICYYFKLNATGMSADSACSSSIYALDAAFQDMKRGLCDKAIICGVHLCLHPFGTLQFARVGVLSPNGVCRPFDDAANGYTRAEASVTLILERAHTAKRIYAELVHSKTNCDGFKKQGITFPSTEMQKVLIREFYDECRVNPEALDFVEAHGTGTVVGDIQELNTLEIFCNGRNQPLLIGTVKSNIGHSEPISGLCSIVKILIGFENGFMPPNIIYLTPRKGVESLENGKIMVVTNKLPLPKGEVFVGINNFGFGGTNGHVLLRRNTPTRSSLRYKLPSMVCVSGRTEEAVLEILNSVSKQDFNSDFLKLIHQIYRKRIPNHIYSGYLISYNGVEIERELSLASILSGKLYMVFNSFEKYPSKLHDALKVIPKCAKKSQEITQISTHLNLRDDKINKFVIQLILADLFKNLNIPNDIQTGGFQIISNFFKNFKTLEETIIGLYNDHSPKIKSVNFFEPNATFLIIGDDTSPRSSSKIHFINPTKPDLLNQMLKSLGKLYLRGFSVELDQLYPEVLFPVGRGTPTISSLIKWDHRHYCRSYKFVGEESEMRSQSVVHVTVTEPNWSYITGHITDGRTLFPATGYLFLAWEALCTSLGKTFPDTPSVVFEDVQFLQAANVPLDSTLSLKVIICQGNDSFAILEDDVVLATGNVYCRSSPEFQKNPPFVGSETLLMGQNDIYKELRLRGYEYQGEFKAIQSYDLSSGTSVISWRNNWVTFMDNMLQLYLLQNDDRNLYVPTSIQKMVINHKKHLKVAALHNNEIPVNIYKSINFISGGGIQITGLGASIIIRKKPIEPILEKYMFVPYEGRMEYNSAIRTIVQTILENSNIIKVKSVEVLTDNEEDMPMMPVVRKCLDDLPLIQSELKILSKNKKLDFPGIDIQDNSLDTVSGCLILITKNIIGNQDLLSTALRVVRNVSGFIISRESNYSRYERDGKVQILASYETEEGTILLLREPLRYAERVPINVSSIDDLSWIERLQSSMMNSKIVLFATGDSNGTMGLVNCLQKESSNNDISAVIIIGDAPPFNIENDFYITQLQKNLVINVYKEKTWGSYRHLSLPDVTLVEREHCYVNTITRGDISSLRWFEGPLSTKTPLANGNVLVQVHYSSINFRDVMLASGKLSLDVITSDRILQKCVQGFEYSGILVSDPSKRVMGMLNGGALSTLVAADPKLFYHVPDDWTLEDAATVPMVYGTVLYAFLMRGKIKKGQSVLIHCGTGGVGQAAINVAIHLGCTVFTTVSTPDKREFIRQHFPSIKDDRIGDSRSTSFEQMVFRGTGGRGVDLVLNSLVEEKLQASVRCLAYNGTFLEIGKFDLANNEKLGTMVLKRQARYVGIMLDELFRTSDEIKTVLGELLKEGIQRGMIKPLVRTAFIRDRIEEAFRYMSAGKHIGKVVIKVREENTYIFNCIPSTFKSYGVNVVVRDDDISTMNGSRALLTFAKSFGSIEGIFNLAVVLKDALFENQTAETFQTSLIPKAYATRNLDLISREICPDLKYFVMFSSVSCGRGNAAQTNYGMANSVMERICEKRKDEGYPALAVQWNTIGDVGIVAEMKENYEEMIIGGTSPQKISSCLQVLDRFLNQDQPVVSSMVVAEKKLKSGTTNMFDTVAKIIGVTNLKAISVHATFPELGMDSIMAVEVKQMLERNYEVFLTARDIRNLTLAKLKGLEGNQTNEKTWKNEISQDIKMIFNQFKKGEVLNNPLVDLKITQDASKVFALPGIEGTASIFNPLVKKTNFGLSSFQFCLNYHLNSIESLADSFVNVVESTPGRFNILAYSFGCIVAIELMHKLEDQGKSGKAFFIDGSSKLIMDIIQVFFPYNDDEILETSLLYIFITKFMSFEEALKHKSVFQKRKSYEEKIRYVLKIFPDTGYDEDFMIKIWKARLSRIKSLINYKVKTKKLKSNIFLAKASKQILLKIAEDYELSRLTYQPVTVKVFDGDHQTILENEHLAGVITDFFKQ